MAGWSSSSGVQGGIYELEAGSGDWVHVRWCVSGKVVGNYSKS